MKFDFFVDKKMSVIGVDISSSAVKMVELTGLAHQKYRLENYATTALAQEAVVDGSIVKLDQVVDAVAKCWRALGTKEKNVALALPTSAVITKKVMMNKELSLDEMESQVHVEASQYIPFSLDEVNIDFCAVDNVPNAQGDIEVVIAASRKEKIEDRVAAVEGAGLQAVIMDIDHYAIEAALSLAPNLLINGGNHQTIMLVDIGANSMKINVLHDMHSVYMRDQAFGGGKLTQEIQRHFSLSYIEAELAKKNNELPVNYVAEVLQPFFQTLVLEINRALQLLTNGTQYSHVDQIILVGGCAAIPNIQKIVSEFTQINTVVYSPFVGMELGSRVKQTQLLKDASSLVVACGLAMRSFA